VPAYRFVRGDRASECRFPETTPGAKDHAPAVESEPQSLALRQMQRPVRKHDRIARRSLRRLVYRPWIKVGVNASDDRVSSLERCTMRLQAGQKGVIFLARLSANGRANETAAADQPGEISPHAGDEIRGLDDRQTSRHRDLLGELARPQLDLARHGRDARHGFLSCHCSMSSLNSRNFASSSAVGTPAR